MGVVLERRLGVDPPEHAHVALGATSRDLAGLRDGHHRGRGEDPADPRLQARAGASSHPAASTRAPPSTRERGITAAMIPVPTGGPAARMAAIEGISCPKEPTRRVDLEVIAAVSIARPLRADLNATVDRYAGQRVPTPWSADAELSTVRPLDGRALSGPVSWLEGRFCPGCGGDGGGRGGGARGPGLASPENQVSTSRPPTSSALRDHVRVRDPPRDLAVARGSRTSRSRLGRPRGASRDDPSTTRTGDADRWLQRSSPVRASNA